MVDKCLPTSQRNVDSRLMSVNPRDAITPQGDKMRNDEEPCYWSDMNPQDVDLDFHTDEEFSSEASVKKNSTKWNS